MKSYLLPLCILAAYPATAAESSQEPAETAPAVPAIGFDNFVKAVKQGEWLLNAPASDIAPGDLVIIDFWMPPAMGPSEFQAEKRGPAGTLKNIVPKQTNGIKTFVMVPPVNQLAKATVIRSLTNPRHATDFPVLWDGDAQLWNYILQGKPLKSMPFAAVFKNGELMWSGEPGHMPGWILTDGTKPGFSAADAKQRLAKEGETFKTLMGNLKKVQELIATKKPEDREAAMRLFDETEALAGNQSFMYMMVAETRIGLAYMEKDLQAALKAMNDVLDKHPDDDYAGNRVLKYCDSLAEWVDKPELKPVRIKAAQVMINGKADDPGYQMACYMIQARIYQELGEKDKAIEACTKGIEISGEQKRLDALKRGETPVIY